MRLWPTELVARNSRLCNINHLSLEWRGWGGDWYFNSSQRGAGDISRAWTCTGRSGTVFDNVWVNTEFQCTALVPELRKHTVWAATTWISWRCLATTNFFFFALLWWKLVTNLVFWDIRHLYPSPETAQPLVHSVSSGSCSPSAVSLLGSISHVPIPTETLFLFHTFFHLISLVCQIYKAESVCFMFAIGFA